MKLERMQTPLCNIEAVAAKILEKTNAKTQAQKTR